MLGPTPEVARKATRDVRPQTSTDLKSPTRFYSPRTSAQRGTTPTGNMERRSGATSPFLRNVRVFGASNDNVKKMFSNIQPARKVSKTRESSDYSYMHDKKPPVSSSRAAINDGRPPPLSGRSTDHHGGKIQSKLFHHHTKTQSSTSIKKVLTTQSSQPRLQTSDSLAGAYPGQPAQDYHTARLTKMSSQKVLQQAVRQVQQVGRSTPTAITTHDN